MTDNNNVPIHNKNPEVANLLLISKSRGCNKAYLPPYSPFLNIIDEFWSKKVKARLSRTKPRSRHHCARSYDSSIQVNDNHVSAFRSLSHGLKNQVPPVYYVMEISFKSSSSTYQRQIFFYVLSMSHAYKSLRLPISRRSSPRPLSSSISSII